MIYRNFKNIFYTIIICACSGKPSIKEEERIVKAAYNARIDNEYVSIDYLSCKQQNIDNMKAELTCSFELEEIFENKGDPKEAFIVKDDLLITGANGEDIDFSFQRKNFDTFIISLDQSHIEIANIGLKKELELLGDPKSRNILELLVRGSIKPKINGCFITQDTCHSDSLKIGTYLDDHESIVDVFSCLKRAKSHHSWCENSVDKVTRAEFYEDGVLIDQAFNGTPIDGCYIEQEQCVKYPEYTGMFMDTLDEAHSKEGACFERALDYHNLCENSSDIVTTAKFYEGKVLISQHVHNSPISGCYIEQSQCLEDEALKGFFRDSDEKAHTDRKICLSKSLAYHNFCGNPSAVITKAKYYLNRELIEQVDHKTPVHGCYIEQENCVKYPEFSGLFRDELEESHDSPNGCMERAYHYQKWCENPISELTQVRFYDDKNLVDEATSSTPLSGCYITQASCSKYPEFTGTFRDPDELYSMSKQACLTRADYYKSWCGNPDDIETRSEFYINRVRQ